MVRVTLTLLFMLGLSSAAVADEPVSPRAIVDQALVAAEGIEAADRRANALVPVLAALIELDDRWRARDLAQEIVSAVAPVADSYSRDRVLNRVVALQAGSRIEAVADESLAGVKGFMEACGAGERRRRLAQPVDDVWTVDESLAVAQAIAGPEERLWALWFIARPLIEADRPSDLQAPIEDALATVMTLNNLEMRVEVSAIIAWVQTLAGDRPDAETTFREATAAAQSLNDTERGEALRYIAAARFAAGDRLAAQTALQDALAAAKASSSADTLGKIAAWQARTGDIDGTLATAQLIGDGSARAWALVHVAAAQAASGHAEAAATLRDAIEATAIEDEADGLAVSDLIEAAQLWPDSMRNTLAAATAIITYQGLGGWQSGPMAVATAPDIVDGRDGLLAWVRATDDAGARLLMLWALAQPLLLVGDQPMLQSLAQEALRIVRPAVAAGEQSSVGLEWSRVLAIIAWLQAEGGDDAGALATADEALALGRAGESSSDLSNLEATVAIVRARAGDARLAIATTEEIADPVERTRALAAIALGGRSAELPN